MVHRVFVRLSGLGFGCAMVAACVGDTPSNPPPDAGAPDVTTADVTVDSPADASTSDASDAPSTSCTNKVKDGDETDVDCGGSCGACGIGKKCAVTADCASGSCANLTCAGWQRSLSGTGTDRGLGVAVDAQGNVFVVGDFFADFNLGTNNFTKLTSAGSCDVFVAKLAPNGDHIWSKRFGSAGCDSAYAVTLDPQGNPYVVGATSSISIDLGKGPHTFASSKNSDLWVARFASSDGSTIWANVYGAATMPSDGAGIPRGYGIAHDGTNVWIAAGFQAAADFGGGTLTSAGADDVIVLRLAGADGAFKSAKRIGGSQIDIAQGVWADATGAYVVGSYMGTIDFGGGPLAATGGHDAFVVAYDATGAFVWQRALGGNNPARPFGSDQAHAVTADAARNVYVAGLSSGGPIALGGGVTANDPLGGVADVFVASYSSAGVPRWATAFGGSGADTAYGIVHDGAGNVVVAGYTESPTLDVGGGAVTHGLGRNAYLSVLGDQNGIPKQGRFLGRTSTSECATLARRPATSSLYLIGTFSGALQTLTGLGGDGGFTDLATGAGPDGFAASLGNVP